MLCILDYMQKGFHSAMLTNFIIKACVTTIELKEAEIA